MRYIPFETFTPSTAWVERARIATDELSRQVTREDKLAYIKAHAQIWRDLRGELIDRFGSRCWFTDAEETVAQLDTEHFRPKAEALDENGTVHEGYWWLAFDAMNMRLAGQIPNRQHKRCYFPLVVGSFRANAADRRWQEENPVFIDPIKLTDVELVGYDESGSMCPSTSAISEQERHRVQTTNYLLGLSAHQPLVEARQRVWSDCRGIIAEIERLLAEDRQYGAPTVRSKGERERLLRQLRTKLLPQEQFSSVAKCCLLMSGLPWAKILSTSI